MATQPLTIDEYLRLPYQIALARGEGEGALWTATISELPGVEASGRTPEEASARVLDAMAAWFENAVAEGRSIPPPWAELSGRLLVRMPRTLHADLARVASRENVSLNQFITGVLASAVSWRQAADAAPPEGATDPPASPSRSPLLRVALLADLVLIALATVAAVVLLVSGS